MGDVKKGHATSKCKQGYAKLQVLVKGNPGGAALQQASVLVKAAHSPDECTLKTKPDGAVVFTVRAGSYEATASADGSAKKQSPRRPFEPLTEQDITLAAGEERSITLELEPVRERVTAHVAAEVATIRCPPPPANGAPPDAPVPEVAPRPVELSLTSDQTYSAYAGGGKLAVPPELEVFEDEKCERPVADGQAFSHEQLTQKKKKLTLHVRGKQAGTFTLGLTLDASGDPAVAVANGDLELESKAVPVVRPKLQVEYRVVQLDRRLSKHVGKNEAVTTDPTVVWLSFDSSAPGQTYDRGILLTATPASRVEAYADQAMTQKLDLRKPIPSATLTGAGDPGYAIYLKGVEKGRFELEAKLDEPSKPKDANPDVLVGEPATAKMAVVELKLQLHRQDTDALARVRVDPNVPDIDDYYTALRDEALPAQEALTDKEKVARGRLLHEQRDGNFGRAQLSVERLVAGDWPEEGCDDYEVVLDEQNVSGGLALFEQEEGGNELAFPLRLRVADLLAANKELWVQGKTATSKALDARLDLGLDRPAAAPAHQRKRNGDWARLTVVRIEEVALDYTAPSGGASAWDEARERFTINLVAPAAKGRRIKLRARLSTPIAGVRVHFMLAPDPDNRRAANWGVDLPGTWRSHQIDWSVKRKDKQSPDHLLHLSGVTDDEGRVSAELQLSQFGGDVFHPAAYIDQDPHLAKYVRGHPQLDARKPVFAAKKIVVWRKLFFQRVVVEGLHPPALAGAVGQYDRIKVEAVDAGDLVVARNKVAKYKPPALYPAYMIRAGGGNGEVLVASDKNKGEFFDAFKKEKDKPNKIPILICDAQCDPHSDGNAGPLSPPRVRADAFPVTINAGNGKNVMSPPLQGGDLLVGGTWKAAERNAGTWINERSGKLKSSDISIDPNRARTSQFRVALPAGVGNVTADTHVWLENIRIKVAAEYLGESFKKRILAVYDPSEPDDFQNTIVHELGHAYGQVVEGDPAGGVAGIPAHPEQVDLGEGNHCRHLMDKCVMYDGGPIAGSLNRYCDVCHPYLLVQDMTTIS